MPEAGYSLVADQQLDELELRDSELYSDIVELCEDILDDPGEARRSSSALMTDGGIVMRTAVPGRYPYKVFWTLEGPRIEAVFPYRS